MQPLEPNDILFKAIQAGKINEFKKSLPLADINYISGIGLTFLHMACSMEKPMMVKLILNDPRLDLSPTLKTKELPSPIHIAYQFKNLKIMDLLIQKEPEFLNVANLAGETIIHEAVKQNKIDIIEHLLTYEHINLSIKNKNDKTAITLAQEKGFDKIASLLESYSLNQKLAATEKNKRNNHKI
jgi:ankyrin repeat protein